MSTIVKTGWLKDKEGNKFAPKTLTSQVQTSDGVLLEDKIQADLDTTRTEILANVTVTVDESLSPTSENPVQNKVIDAEFEAISTAMNVLEQSIDGKADAVHSHSASEITDLQSKLDVLSEETKSYTDTAVSGLASTSSVDTSISTHNTSTSAHSDIRELISDLSTALNNFLDVDDTTKDQLSEVLTLIDNNKGTLESLTTSKVNVSDIVDNLTTNSSDKVLSASQGVALKSLIDSLQSIIDGKANSEHTHTIEDVTNLQSSLDGKSNIGHTHTVENITDLTATATELNYMSGVTSNVQTQLDGKSNTGHIHAVSDVTNLQSSLDSKVPLTRTVNGKALTEDIVLSPSDVGADASGSADAALSSAQTYTDNAVAQKTQVQIIRWGDDD